ncbi:DUF3489 domain-containing protein [Qipengyuania oceanensis]|uniref:DUF3489 domain-containing protein n=1 Tax=Qipengyuania oceanensis TaxID=1463597 RepID=A0A844YJ17_9SPHN|nr:DUF3489 domain-containing protein [Qipengyuania oceanensis]MXO63937.1 DUF3489 domain-containing protein [Qipengyuania oceanensis]
MTTSEKKKASSKAAQKSPIKAGTKPNFKSKGPTRLDQLQELITREGGASISEMVEATGWQQHSVRGALAGALKKRGLAITSEKIEGVRRYQATAPAQ